MKSQITTSPAKLDSGTKDSHPVHPERGGGEVGGRGGFIFLSAYFLLSAPCDPPPPPQLLLFLHSSIFSPSFGRVCHSEGHHFFKGLFGDGELATWATSLDESTEFGFGQVRKWTKMIARPTFNSITSATKIEFGPDSSSTISGGISTLAFLVSARLFGLVDSCFFGLRGSGGLVLSGEELGAGRDFKAGAQICLAGGGKRARLDG